MEEQQYDMTIKCTGCELNCHSNFNGYSPVRNNGKSTKRLKYTNIVKPYMKVLRSCTRGNE